jgi:hypothetical protein
MKAELEKKLVDRWPKWFDVRGSISHTLMPFGFPGDGWFDLIWKLCEDLEPLVGLDFEVIQVKEKFGGLRFYADFNGPVSDQARNRISQAENDSYTICEECGAFGRERDGGWIKVRCDTCETKDA